MTMLAEQPPVAVVRRTPKRWTKAEFRRATAGVFEGQRVYLYRGELIQMAGMGALHIQGMKRLDYWLHETFRPACDVYMQMPFELPDESEPQPDGAVYTAEQEARRPCPNAAVLIVEVADSSIELDQEMADDYAAAGVPDFWIDNVPRRRGRGLPGPPGPTPRRRRATGTPAAACTAGASRCRRWRGLTCPVAVDALALVS